MHRLALAAVLAGAVACGSRQPAAGPAAKPGVVPLAGLESVSLGEGVDQLEAAFPGASFDQGYLWVPHATVEGRGAAVAFGFTDGRLESVLIAFDGSCADLPAIGTALDARLGARTSAEPGIAAWARAGWNLALYCAGQFPRLDVHPAAQL